MRNIVAVLVGSKLPKEELHGQSFVGKYTKEFVPKKFQGLECGSPKVPGRPGIKVREFWSIKGAKVKITSLYELPSGQFEAWKRVLPLTCIQDYTEERLRQRDCWMKKNFPKNETANIVSSLPEAEVTGSFFVGIFENNPLPVEFQDLAYYPDMVPGRPEIKVWEFRYMDGRSKIEIVRFYELPSGFFEVWKMVVANVMEV